MLWANEEDHTANLLSVFFLPRHHDLTIINSGRSACFIVDSSKSAVTASCHRREVRYTADEEIGNPLTFFFGLHVNRVLRSPFLWLQGRTFYLAKDRFSSEFPPHYLNCWETCPHQKGRNIHRRKNKLTKKQNNHDKNLPLWGTGLHLEKSQRKPRVWAEKNSGVSSHPSGAAHCSSWTSCAVFFLFFPPSPFPSFFHCFLSVFGLFWERISLCWN